MPKVSVIVPHYRDYLHLDRCLSGLMRQNFSREEFEVVVADNGSPEGLAVVTEIVGGRARIVVVEEKGAGPARNGGVAIASGTILAFTDSDCEPEPDWLLEGLRALDECDFVGGRVKVLVDDPKHMTAVEAFECVFAFDFKTYVTRKGFAGAGNLFCSRAVFDNVGGFRTGVSEDIDWSHRATAAGYAIGYAPKAVVGHPARKSWAELLSKWKRINREIYKLQTTQNAGRIGWFLRTLALPLSAVAHTPRVLLSPELNTFGQRLSALGVLYRLRLWRFIDGIRILTETPAS